MEHRADPHRLEHVAEVAPVTDDVRHLRRVVPDAVRIKHRADEVTEALLRDLVVLRLLRRKLPKLLPSRIHERARDAVERLTEALRVPEVRLADGSVADDLHLPRPARVARCISQKSKIFQTSKIEFFRGRRYAPEHNFYSGKIASPRGFSITEN